MAYIAPYLTEEEKKKAAANGGTEVSTSKPSSGVIPSGPTGAPAPNTAAAAPTPGTGFVNLQQYLNMNENEGGRLASAATKGVTDKVSNFQQTAGNIAQTGAAEMSKAAGGAIAKDVSAGLQKDASAAYSDADAFLGKGFTDLGGKAASEYTTGLAADKTVLASELGKVGDADTQKAGLAETYGKSGNYTSGFGALDQFLIGGTSSGQNKINEVKGKTANVSNAFDQASNKLTTAEQNAKAALDANKQKVLNVAKNTKTGLVEQADRDIASKNSNLNLNNVGASKAGYKDVLTEDQILDIEALNKLIEETGDYRTGGWNPGQSVPTAPEPVKPTTSGPTKPNTQIGSPGSVADILGVAGQAGATISDTAKDIAAPTQGVVNAGQAFISNPNAQTATDLLKKAGVAPGETAQVAAQKLAGVLTGLNDRTRQELDRLVPGLGAIADLDVGTKRGADVLNQIAPALNPQIKIPSLKNVVTGNSAASADAKLPDWAKGQDVFRKNADLFANGSITDQNLYKMAKTLNVNDLAKLQKLVPNPDLINNLMRDIAKDLPVGDAQALGKLLTGDAQRLVGQVVVDAKLPDWAKGVDLFRQNVGLFKNGTISDANLRQLAWSIPVDQLPQLQQLVPNPGLMNNIMTEIARQLPPSMAADLANSLSGKAKDVVNSVAEQGKQAAATAAQQAQATAQQAQQQVLSARDAASNYIKSLVPKLKW